jgi:Tat protein secretion system quality control protein TatD with DNase activity
MRAHIREAKAVGETGLDFWYKGVRKDDDKKREQRDVFSRHLALAREFDLPIVIHSRGAWQECLEMACSAKVRKAEFHWYSGPVDVLKDIIDAGFLISCTPALAYSPELRKAVEFAPLERIMVETDTPVSYSKTLDTGHWTLETDVQKPTSSVECQVSSVSKDSKIPSTPKDVWRTLRLLSSIKGRSEDDVLAAVERNARDFFKIGTR